MFLFVLLASDESEPRLRNIHISFIHLRQVWGLSIWVWAAYEEYSYLFRSPRTGLRDIHPGLMQVWGMCIFVVLPHTALSRESGIFIHLWHVWRIFIWILARCEDCLCVFYLPHTGLWQMWGTFTGVLSAFYGSHPSVSNIHIGFIFTKCMWQIFIKLWGRFHKCLFLFYLPHTCMSWMSGILDLFASNRFEPTVRNIDISFIHLKCLCGIFTQVWGGCEDYLYLPKISTKIQ